jgi:hypothetical protein
MTETKNQTTSIDDFYKFCSTNNKLTEEQVDNLLILTAINNDEITDAMLRGYLPIAWAACVRIAKAMDNLGVAKYVEHFTEPVVHLSFEDRDGWWRTVES